MYLTVGLQMGCLDTCRVHLAILLFAVGAVVSVDSANILLISASYGSRHFTLSAIGRALIEHDHNVTQIRSDLFKGEAEANRLPNSPKMVYYQSSADYMETGVTPLFQSSMQGSAAMTAVTQTGKNFMKAVALESSDMLLDRSLREVLNSTRFDLVLSDMVLISSLVYSKEMGLPLISVVTNLIAPPIAKSILVPNYPSYVPEFYTKMGDRMDFGERVQNLLFYGLIELFNELIVIPAFMEVLSNYSLTRLDMKTVPNLWLGNVDFSLEFARPVMPYAALMGGILARPANIPSIDKKLLEFMDSSGDSGVVIMSFGSYVRNMSEEMALMFTSALGRLEQKVVWKVADNVRLENLPENIMTVEWIPQNDLLGHPKTRVLVTHGGIHSTYEAIYHGVPVVGVPILYDQFDDLTRLSKMGAGVSLSQGLPSLTADQLYIAINQVMSNKRYKESMLHLSSILRDYQMSPVDRAVFWIEHVLQFGTGDIKPRHLFEDLNTFQLYMLDIAAAAIILCFIIVKIVKILINSV